MAAVWRQIKEELSTAKQYTHSLFDNLKLEFNPHINQLTEWQAQLELQMQQDLVPPSTNPFASTPQSSNPRQMNAAPIPSHINTPTSHPMGDNHRPPRNLHGENWLSDIAGEVPPPGIRTDHNVSSHVNEETLQLAAMGPNILMASITQAQLASTKLQVANKITPFDGNRSNYCKWIQQIEQHTKLNSMDPSDLAASTCLDYVSEFVNGLKTQVSWLELKKHLAKEYGHIIDDQDDQYKLNNVQKQPGQWIRQYIKDIDDIVEHMSDTLDSQIKAAFIQGLDDNTLVGKLLSKPSFTFDDCTKYALEYEQTEDRLGTHKKNTGMTVNSVTAQDSELSPGKQINQTVIVCDH